MEACIYRKRAISGTHKARMGWGEILWLHWVRPCWVCSGGNIRDLEDRTLKDKSVTEGKAQIFNDLPEAHHQPRRFLGHGTISH